MNVSVPPFKRNLIDPRSDCSGYVSPFAEGEPKYNEPLEPKLDVYPTYHTFVEARELSMGESFVVAGKVSFYARSTGALAVTAKLHRGALYFVNCK